TTVATANASGFVVGSTTDLLASGGGEWTGGRWMPIMRPSASWVPVSMRPLADLLLFYGDFDPPSKFRAYIGGAFRYPATETACNDYFDDDNDFLVDCADPD